MYKTGAVTGDHGYVYIRQWLTGVGVVHKSAHACVYLHQLC
jgi:hypothetical protein